MGGDSKHLSPGDRWQPTATFVNGAQDAIDFVKSQLSSGGAIPRPMPATAPWNTVLVKNVSCADAGWNAVLGLGGILIAPDANEASFRSRPVFKAQTPTVKESQGRWVVTTKPIPRCGVGMAIIAGAAPVRVYVNSVDDRYCDITEPQEVGEDDETCYLGTGQSGAQILGMEYSAAEGQIAWAVVRLAGDAGDAGTTTTSTTTTTTTTANPAYVSGCTGTCRWVWSERAKYWSLVTNGCNTTTTTTTSTTTTGDPSTTTTTTSTPSVCDCPEDSSATTSTTTSSTTSSTTTSSTTTSTTTSTTSTTTSTTTTPAPCQCMPPTYCGEYDGECTATNCVSGKITTPTLDCDPTTTTTPEGCHCEDFRYVCPSTTTTARACGTAVVTVGCPVGPCTEHVWYSSGCSSGPYCCHGLPSIDCGVPVGTQVTMPCYDCTPAPTTPPPCECSCQWTCVGFAEGSSDWQLNVWTWPYWYWWTYYNEIGCGCDKPATPCTSCEQQITYCYEHQVANTTSTTPNPCTTTTLGPCEEDCRWQWDTKQEIWHAVRIPCDGTTCQCNPPSFSGDASCSTAHTPCIAGLTSTTTTTTLCAGCGYVCSNNTWTLSYNHCNGGCDCPSAPSGKCISGSKLFKTCSR